MSWPLLLRRGLLTALALGLVLTRPVAADGGEVAVGVFAYQGERAAVADWGPLITYLNGALPGQRFRLDNYDAAGLRQAIEERRVDLVITNPGYYIALEADYGLSRIATLSSPRIRSTDHAIASAVLVRASRTDLQQLRDLAGRTVGAVAPEAFGGYLVAARELLRAGVDPESDLEELRFLGLPMTRIIEAVQRGEVDAGIVRACLPEQLAAQGLLRLEDFRVLSPRIDGDGPACAASTPSYPDWPIAVAHHTDPALGKAVARALLAMPEDDSGIAWSVPGSYQSVHDLYRELRVGPYAYLREITPEGLVRRFWPWLLSILLILGTGVVHTVRVEHLVQQRTRELRESLAAREAAEQRMRENQEQLDHLARLSALGELSGNIAHEINQPLAAIGTYARGVLRRQADGKLTAEAVTEACTEIASEAERAGEIVQRIRHFARKRLASREPVDLAAMADETVHLIAGLLARTPDIRVERPAGVLCPVLADGLQIQQVLVNLVKNALDACREVPEGRRVIRVVLEMAGNRALVHVIDRGAGLAPAKRDHLFEPFFTTKPDGLGLGLPICKTIIEAHGGRLWAEANGDGVGMRFSFSLPCHDLRT